MQLPPKAIHGTNANPRSPRSLYCLIHPQTQLIRLRARSDLATCPPEGDRKSQIPMIRCRHQISSSDLVIRAQAVIQRGEVARLRGAAHIRRHSIMCVMLYMGCTLTPIKQRQCVHSPRAAVGAERD